MGFKYGKVRTGLTHENQQLDALPPLACYPSPFERFTRHKENVKQVPFSDFQTESGKEQEGIVRNFGDFWVKIARAGGSNKKYEKAVERLTKPHRRAIELEALPDAIYTKLIVEAYAEAVVLDWGGDGATDDEGTVLPCTKENVIAVMTKYPDLFQMLVKDAQNFQLYKNEGLKADEKNS